MQALGRVSQEFSVGRVRVISNCPIVFSRRSESSPLEVFPRYEFTAITFENLFVDDPGWKDAQLRPWRIFPMREHKDLPGGYKPMKTGLRRSIGKLFTAFHVVATADLFQSTWARPVPILLCVSAVLRTKQCTYRCS